MEFFWQEYWGGLPFPPPRGLPDPGIEPASPVSPALQADLLTLSHHGNPHHSSLSDHKCWAVTSESKVWIVYSNPINCPQNRNRCMSLSQGFSLRYSWWWSFISFPAQSPLSLSLEAPYLWSLVLMCHHCSSGRRHRGRLNGQRKISLKEMIF